MVLSYSTIYIFGSSYLVAVSYKHKLTKLLNIEFKEISCRDNMLTAHRRNLICACKRGDML